MSPRRKVQGPEDGPGRFSDAQSARLGARDADQDRTLEAMHILEAALGTAAPGRLKDWKEAVSSALAVLDEATAEEAANGRAPAACWQTSLTLNPGCGTACGVCDCSTASSATRSTH